MKTTTFGSGRDHSLYEQNKSIKSIFMSKDTTLIVVEFSHYLWKVQLLKKIFSFLQNVYQTFVFIQSDIGSRSSRMENYLICFLFLSNIESIINISFFRNHISSFIYVIFLLLYLIMITNTFNNGNENLNFVQKSIYHWIFGRCL